MCSMEVPFPFLRRIAAAKVRFGGVHVWLDVSVHSLMIEILLLFRDFDEERFLAPI